MNAFRFLAATAALTVAMPASADTICEWMEYSQRINDAAAPPPSVPRLPDHEQAVTQVALAMFEATNAIDRRYESYLKLPLGDARASQNAAAATAAYQVLIAHFPGQKMGLEDSYAIAMEAVTDANARRLGKEIGERAAKAALTAGGIDPAVTLSPYRPRTAPGVWIGAQLPVFEPYTFAFRTWFLPSLDAVRPGPPPALGSETWTRDFEEVKRLGARGSKDRTAHQTLMARYRITPNMMPSYRAVADAAGRSLVQNARMFALVEMASEDAGRAMAAAKIHYNFWRPITAIRNAEDDGNPATAPDTNWIPLINTPNHPEYPCGHCTYASTIATVLKSETGNVPPGGVRVASLSVPNSAVQWLPTLDDWVREVSFSRILGGVHYRFSNDAGEEIGRKVGTMAVTTILKPLPAAKQRPART
ncbi:vanadium-dependent haloperoxidase [Sphingomonas sp. LT1P40]|uniref:vanadium-dependent haloperoxidase n=1 Tax=Alteristakelama amylovorans TaxID=3096166 RepID=UPI002FC8FC5C